MRVHVLPGLNAAMIAGRIPLITDRSFWEGKYNITGFHSKVRFLLYLFVETYCRDSIVWRSQENFYMFGFRLRYRRVLKPLLVFRMWDLKWDHDHNAKDSIQISRALCLKRLECLTVTCPLPMYLQDWKIKLVFPQYFLRFIRIRALKITLASW